ncbi:MAG: tRNA dimethylallyltransferase [Pseudohongiellaceae bacterium]|jgi:tRNA dimethylallyltransferase
MTAIHRVLVGGTGSGKKKVAAELHRRFGLQLLSMDSMKVYRGMNIGTDKPDADLLARAPFGLLDLSGHDEAFSAGRWVEAAVSAVASAPAHVLFAGGTPLYLRLLLRGLFPGPPANLPVRQEIEQLWDDGGEAAVRAELVGVDPEIEGRLLPGDRRRLVRALEVWRVSGRALSSWQREETRPPIAGKFVVVALRHQKQHHGERLAQRVHSMVERGLVAEVEALLEKAAFAKEAGGSIGYAEAQDHLQGTLDLAQMIERITVRSRQLVRKQRTFLASHDEIRWIDVGPEEPLPELVERVAEALELTTD